ncbi:MAG: group 1 truncated hemoglobin, partial [Bdellovibrionaceae bacterium]|nr:group 1 truncated hemoglobin [Pseudobdellovibrionaceae bacterium]
SMVTGGPVKYSGKDMAAAHSGMKIKGSEFDALAADLVKALDKFNVPANEKNELMTLVASTKAAIVEVDDQGNPEPAAKAAAPVDKNSLFARLGGTPAVTAVVDSFVNTAAADKRVNFFRDGKFKNLNVPHLKEQLVKFISMATGGPKAYNGLDMKTAHEGMKIKSSEFDAIAEDLSLTLDKFKVPAKEKGELMAIAASTKKDIVSQ